MLLTNHINEAQLLNYEKTYLSINYSEILIDFFDKY